MTKTPTLIAALQAGTADPALFDEIAAEVDLALDRLPSSRNATQRDGNDLYLFDRDALRVGIGWVPQEAERTACIVCAVGAHDPDGQRHLRPTDIGPIAHALVDHVSDRLTSDLVLWHSSAQVLDADLMDIVTATLTQSGAIALKDREKTPRPLPVLTRVKTRTEAICKDPTPSQTEQARMARAVARASAVPEEDVLRELRTIITEPGPMERISWAVRVAMVAWSYTFLIIQPPVGASMLTYTTLRSALNESRYARN